MYIYQTIGPLPSSKNPHFQNKAKCTTFIVKMSLRMKNISISKAEHLTYIYVVLIQRPVGTRNGLFSVGAVFTYNSCSSLAKRKYSNSQIFKAAEELDMGCGVGGGKDSRDIFKVGVQEYITRVKQSK